MARVGIGGRVEAWRDPAEPGRPHFTYTSSRNGEAAEQERDWYGVTRTSIQTRIFCSRGETKYKSLVFGVGEEEGRGRGLGGGERPDVRRGKTDSDGLEQHLQ